MAGNKTTVGVEVIVNDKASKQLGVLKTKLKSFSSGISGISQKLTSGIGSGINTLGKGLTAVGTAGTVALGGIITDATKLNTEFIKLQNQLGLTDDEMQNIKKSVKEIYESGFGESFSEVAEALGLIRRETGASGEDLEKYTKNLLTVSKTYDQDVRRSLGAVDILMENFGTTFEQSTDLIISGLQNSGDQADDFIDTLREYSGNFKDAQFSGKEFINFLLNGLKGGAYNFDVVADASREFFIKFQEGNNDAKVALASLGLSYNDLKQDFNTGRLTGKGLLDIVSKKLSEVDDQTDRFRITAALIGTKAEDLGDQFATGLASASDVIGDFEGKTNNAVENIEENYTNVFRKLRVEFLKIGESFIPIFEKISDFFKENPQYIEDFTNKISEWIEAFDLQPLLENLNKVFGLVGDVTGAIGGLYDRFQVGKGFISEGFKEITGVGKYDIDEQGNVITRESFGERIKGLVGEQMGTDTTRNLSQIGGSEPVVSTLQNILAQNQGNKGSVNVNINMSNNVIKDNADEKRMAKEISDKLQREMTLYNKGVK